MDMCVESLIPLDAVEWVDLWTLNVACYRHASIRMHHDCATITYTSYLIWVMFSHTSIMIPFPLFITWSHCHICVINAVFSLFSVHLIPSNCICPHSSCDRLPKYDTSGQHSDVHKWTATTCPARWVVRTSEW